MVGLHRSSSRAHGADLIPTLFVTNSCSNAVTAYPASSNGDVAPLAPAPITDLSAPEYEAVDKSGNIYVTNFCNAVVTIYAKGTSGNTAPIAIIGGSNTGLSNPQGIALDSNGNIYVADFNAKSVFVYPALGSSTGLLNEAPTATISGINTGMVAPVGIALDGNRKIYVTDFDVRSVFVYPALGSSSGLLNEAPTATISGSNTGLIQPQGVVLDSSGNVYVADFDAKSVFVYPALGSSTGMLNEAPTATIKGNNTGLITPFGITLDASRNIYVADEGDIFTKGASVSSVFVYPAIGSSTGTLNEAPTATISGSNTGLLQIVGIALDASGKIYAADDSASSVFAYPALGVSTGILNEAPTATISGSNAGLLFPQGIALDSGGKIYVVNGNPMVSVYPAGSNANSSPIATISGNNTGLQAPEGIAVDASGNIYVADPNAGSVFVYPPTGSSTGVLNEAPTATISGSNTGLRNPFGITLDSSGKIYVADEVATSVFVYPALGSSTGMLNEAPSATISGSNTGLRDPVGITLDSNREIYVADDVATSVFVYPALGSSTGALNEAPTATISGSNTGLRKPFGVAVDASANIYVADFRSNGVFVYSAGSNGNVTPIATISGPETELGAPEFIAIHSEPGPTPTATATGTPTATPTATATSTTTATATKTATATATSTATATATRTATTTSTATATATPVPVTLTIKPKALKFSTRAVGTQSSPKTIKVSNPKGNRKHRGLPVLIEMISDPAVFKQTNTCPQSLPAGASCAISVTFTPSMPTKQIGTLTITDNAKHGMTMVPLSGRGK